jgi:hypothetical protein
MAEGLAVWTIQISCIRTFGGEFHVSSNRAARRSFFDSARAVDAILRRDSTARIGSRVTSGLLRLNLLAKPQASDG